ncbi:hypothetical protein ACA910_012285 [Epithemia clementina (nom. ined.)]
MGPSAASTAEDGPLCRPEPLIVTTNVHDDLIPRLQDGTRLIGLKTIPFNSSTFQDDDLEEMLLLVLPTVPLESATMATPTITLEHKKKLQQLLLNLKLEVKTVVSRRDQINNSLKGAAAENEIGPPYRGSVWQILQYHRSICKKVIQKSQKQQNLRTRRTAEEIEVTRRQLEKKKKSYTTRTTPRMVANEPIGLGFKPTAPW